MYAFTTAGLRLAARIADDTAIVYAPESLKNSAPAALPCGMRFFSRLRDLMPESFPLHACHIFIGAAGIAVRAVAPLLGSKLCDPAVLVIDQRGKFVISLLSGHAGGANSYAKALAARLEAVPVITTATDIEGLPAIDQIAAERGLHIANPEMIKRISAAVLSGATPPLFDPDDLLGLGCRPGKTPGKIFIPIPQHDGPMPYERLLGILEDTSGPCVAVSEYDLPERLLQRCLLLHPKTLCAGVGCKKGTGGSALEAFIRQVFAENRLSLRSLACLASIEAKRQEQGLWQAARTLGVPLVFFTADALRNYPVQNFSTKAMEIFDLSGVAEPAALAAASKISEEAARAARLLLPKIKGTGMTLALARVQALQ